MSGDSPRTNGGCLSSAARLHRGDDGMSSESTGAARAAPAAVIVTKQSARAQLRIAPRYGERGFFALPIKWFTLGAAWLPGVLAPSAAACGSTSISAGEHEAGAPPSGDASGPILATMNDVSILFPLPTSAADIDNLLAPSATGTRGVLLPSAVYAATGPIFGSSEQPVGPGSPSGIAAYGDPRVVAMRIDPCFASLNPDPLGGGCTAQIRLVFHREDRGDAALRIRRHAESHPLPATPASHPRHSHFHSGGFVWPLWPMGLSGSRDARTNDQAFGRDSREGTTPSTSWGRAFPSCVRASRRFGREWGNIRLRITRREDPIDPHRVTHSPHACAHPGDSVTNGAHSPANHAKGRPHRPSSGHTFPSCVRASRRFGREWGDIRTRITRSDGSSLDLRRTPARRAPPATGRALRPQEMRRPGARWRPRGRTR